MSRARTEMIDVGKIALPERLLRTSVVYEELEELANSIKRHGQIHPILVRQVGNRYVLIAGLRRYMCIKYMRRGKILARILTQAQTEDLPLAMAENLHRAPLPIVDEARAVKELVEKEGSIPRVMRMLVKSETWVRQRLDLLKLPEYAQQAVGEGNISVAAALELNKISDPKLREYYLHYGAKTGVTLEQAKLWRAEAEHTKEITPPQREIAWSSDDGIPPAGPILRECHACGEQVDIVHLWVIRVCTTCRDGLAHAKEMIHGRDSSAEQSENGDDAAGEYRERHRMESDHHRHEGREDPGDAGEAGGATGPGDGTDPETGSTEIIATCAECGELFTVRSTTEDILCDPICDACLCDLPAVD